MAPYVVLLALLLLGPFVALTAAGGRRRGAGWTVAVLSGLAFPLTWIVWYARDEHPIDHYRRPRGALTGR